MEFLQKLTEENVEQLLEFLRVKSFGRDLTLALTTLGLVQRIVSLNATSSVIDKSSLMRP